MSKDLQPETAEMTWFCERTPQMEELGRLARILGDWVASSGQPGQPPAEAHVSVNVSNANGKEPANPFFLVSVSSPCAEVWIGPQVQTWFGVRVRWSLHNNSPRCPGEPIGYVAPRGFGGPSIPFHTLEQYDELHELTEAGYFDNGSQE